MFCASTQKETSCVTTCTAEQVRNKAVVSCVCISAPEMSGEANFGRLLPVDPTTPASGSNRDNKEEATVKDSKIHGLFATHLWKASSNNTHYSNFSCMMSHAPSALLTLSSPLNCAATHSSNQPPKFRTPQQFQFKH
ncbi:hypothetical protein COCVIDRAFT_39418 [Bipolaris victoriae FI3]|uniref:Uncharacterized protein n=1 Tax=Bipolaris victoriae (strain FI3) TaxID=930091 RepID=W7E3U6_BIPV3|nr:hypothetical protein COCVIDRAFT_39418 [Bipolaris victoriae FI3]